MDQQPGARFGARIRLDDEIAAIPPAEGSDARHRAEVLLRTDALRVMLVTILAGGALHTHTAPGPVVIHVVRGRVSVNVDGEEMGLDAGELISLPGSTAHAVTGVEDGAFVLTMGAPVGAGEW